MHHFKPWIQGAIIYQIYPRSFFDSNDDGVGDIRGITCKLDYLNGKPHSLGVDAIWISPFYTSPMADFGYDVSDYCSVDPIFGTNQDFQLLVTEAHRRGIKVMVDFVPNHSSSAHPWFLQSSSSRRNPRRDWYVWRDPKKGGGPPNNWRSIFGGPAWTLDKQTGQYYLHTFLKEQPDLNWDNPKLREAMKDNMRFWLDMGVDGFRVDAVPFISKDPLLRDDELHPDADKDRDYGDYNHPHSRDGPKLFDYINEMAGVLREYPERYMITEGYPDRRHDHTYLPTYYQYTDAKVTLPFNFGCLHMSWEAHRYNEFVTMSEAALPEGHQSVYSLGNHDNPRLATRLGRPAARTAAMLQFTLPGAQVMYYGEEIGMTDVMVPPERQVDPGRNAESDADKGRDPERTPMQWDNTKYVGFSEVEPWLPVGHNREEINVQSEREDPQSFLSLYKQLFTLRHEYPALHSGNYAPFELGQKVFGYERWYKDQRLIVLLNFTKDRVRITNPQTAGKIILSTHMDSLHTGNIKALRPHEGVIILAENLLHQPKPDVK